MSFFDDVLNSAQLSIAAYATLRPGEIDQAENQTPLLEVGIPPALQGDLATRYPTVLRQFNDTPTEGGMGTSFSVTVFTDSDGNLTLAFRGTQELTGTPSDATTGAYILLDGAGYDQIVAMVNWWNMVASPVGQMVNQYRLTLYPPTGGPTNGVPLKSVGEHVLVLEDAPEIAASGALLQALALDPDGRVDLAGHSLGGHLAMAFSSIFGTRSGRVTVFNAPGFKDSTTNQAFFGRFGGSVPASASIINVAGDEALVQSDPLNLIAGLHSRPGQAINIAIEDQRNSGETAPFGSRNHSSVILADSLAVYKLLSDLDPTLTTHDYKAILNQAVKGTAAGYERIVDALKNLFGRDDTFLPVGNASRDALHQANIGLRSSDTYLSRAGLLQIRPISNDVVTLLEQAAAGGSTGLAYRYAVRELNPFVVVDLGSTGLYGRFQAGGTNAGELDSYDAITNPKGLTQPYLSDRARMLAFLMTGNADDTSAFASNQVSDQVLYQDLVKRPVPGSADGKLTELNVFLAGGMANPRGPNTRVISFGTRSSDALQGRENTDRLYGGTGADVLAGSKSNDYLEGGAGMDVYAYSAETSILFPNTNDGDDELRDTDGKGVIRYMFTGSGSFGTTSRVIGGAALKVTPTQWQSPDGKFIYDRQGSDLLVTINGDAGGSIMIRDFDFSKAEGGGYLGIRFVDPLSAPDSFARTFYGDKRDWDPDGDPSNGVQTQTDAFGNAVRADGQDGRPDLVQADRADTFYGSAADEAEKFSTVGGDDVVYGDGPSSFTSPNGGRDLIETGAGRDVVTAGAGNDWIEGGSGGDILGGNLGDDALFGDSSGGQTLTLSQAIAFGESGNEAAGPGDLMTGDAGNDVIVGAATADLIYGGEGADVVVGGAGADNVYGDGTSAVAGLEWTATRTITVVDGIRRYVLDTPGVVAFNVLDAGSADVIYGGAGADWAFGGAGDDYLEGGNSAGNANVDDDVLFGEAGSDVLVGGSGKDFLHGDSASVDAAGLSGDDYLDGGVGDDELVGYKGSDILIGGEGVDTLDGGEGDDLVWGGRGNDIILGGPGKDTYVYHRGDGEDVIRDPDIATGSQYLNELALGPGISRDQVKFRLASLMVDLGEGDAIHFNGFDPDDPLSTPVLGSIQFADGESMTYAEVLDQGFDLDGTEGNDEISGTAVTDRIDGKGGNDRILGKAGNDSIIGGAGRDDIEAGDGEDTVYGGDDTDVVEGGAGDDAISGEAGNDVLKGGDGADALDGGSGEDFIDAGAGDDVIDAGSENDFVLAGSGDGAVSAGDGDDVVKAGEGDDEVFGDGGDDSLEGEAGDDLLAGGTGGDLLIGGAGSDTYFYNLGDGHDVIADGGDPGVDVVDTLSFGVGMADVSLTRLQNGDLLARLADGGTVSVAGMYGFGGSNRLERIEFADGSFLDAPALAGLPEDLILGTEGADTLVGSFRDETIEGRGGDDSLDGREGADTLVGGAGQDRYRLGYGTQRDIVVEAAGEASTIELESGLTLADVRATQGADDLVLTVRGTGNELVVQGYFAAAQAITVSEAGGASATAGELLESGAAPLDREALKEDFRIAERVRFFQDWVADGFTPVDGFTLEKHQYPEFRASFSQNFETITTTVVASNGSSSTTVQNLVLSNWSYTAINAVVHTTARLDFALTESDDGVIAAPSTGGFQNTPGEQWVQMQWKTASSQSFTSQRVDIFPFQGGFIRHEYTDNWVSGTAVAQSSEVPDGVEPFESPENGLFPRFRRIGKGDGIHTRNVSEVLAGPGNNEIAGAYIADGGAGDDVILDAALALGGDGNDVIFGGAALYGEAGDDRLTFGPGAGDHLPRLMDGGSGNDVLRREQFGDGVLMLPGSGDDLMAGERNADIYRIGAGDTGEKIVWDAGAGVFDEAGFTTVNLRDRVELPSAATLDSISLSWSFLDPLSELGQELEEAHLTLDLSWGEGTIVRLVRPRDSDGEAAGVDIVRLGDATELSVDELVALAPPPPMLPIHGTQFDDLLSGDLEADTIFGFAGNDVIEAGDSDDIIEGGEGDDYLAGRAGGDTYVYRPGDGNDTLIETQDDAGAVDTLRLTGGILPEDVAVERDDTHLYLAMGATGERLTIEFWVTDPQARIERVEFDGGTTWSADDLQARSIYVGTGLVLFGTDESEALVGGEGPDYIAGFGGDDTLSGLHGDDVLDGGDGDDLVVGGPGNDTLVASPGADTYLLEPGGGNDAIEAPFFGGPTVNEDRVRAADALTPEDIVLTRGWEELAIGIAATGEGIVVPFWFSDPSQRLGGLEFADGTFWDADEMETRLQPATATDGDDTIFATAGDDVVESLAGEDNVIAGAGDDRVDGGDDGDLILGEAGNDILRGGAGDDDVEDWEGANLLDGGPGDDYLYHAGNAFVTGGPGDDWIDNYGPSAVIAFNPGDGNDLVYAADSFTLSLGGGIVAADLSLSQDGANLRLAIGAEDSVTLSREFEADPQAWPEITLQLFGSVHTFDLDAVIEEFYAGLALQDVLESHRTGFSESAAMGGALAWDYATEGGTDGLSAEQVLEVLGGANFGLAPQPIAPGGGNQPPVVANPIADQQALEDTGYFLQIAADAFSDPGDAVTYAASLANGDSLPGWLSFDADTRSFSGTPLQADVGALAVRVTATDPGGLSAFDDFTLNVANVNDAPTVASAIADHTTREDAAYAFTVPEETFADEDMDDALAWFASRADGMPLPAWLSFDQLSRTFSGTPRQGDVGAIDVRVVANDGELAAEATFELTVLNVNDAPVVASPTGEQSFEAGTKFTFAVPANTFADEDAGDSLSLSTGPLPSWLMFDPASAIFTGTPGRKENGISHIVLTATDAAGASVSTEFGLVIHARPNATVVGGKGDDVMYGGTGNNVLVAQGGNDALFAGDGNDVLHGGKGQNLLDGGAGNDVVFGGRGSSLIAGGAGNDIIHTGSGSDVLLFNRGDGSDTVLADRSADNTLSFGGGIGYDDITLSRSGKDLVVGAGGDDRVVLRNWYAGKHSVANLQFVLDSGEVQTFDFLKLAGAFDSARRASPGLTSWDVTNALLQFHLWGGDDEALGGDLAYWYARNRGFAGISLAVAQQVLGAPGFGSDAQTLRPFNGLQEGLEKLA